MLRLINKVRLFLPAILFLFLMQPAAEAFEARVLPDDINPGDAFLVRITGAGPTEVPEAAYDEKQVYLGSCGEGCFIGIGAVDLETKPGVHKVRVGTATGKAELRFSVKSVKFPSLHLTLPEEKVTLGPEDMKRAEAEAEKLKVIWQTSTERLWQGSFSMPLENDISTVFGAKRIINKKKISVHRGADIKGKEGEAIRASNRGRVILAEELFFGGNTIILDHGHGIFTVYMHLSSFNVKAEDIIPKGNIIGFVGQTGRSKGPHLHFGVKVMGINTNPLSFVGLKL